MFRFVGTPAKRSYYYEHLVTVQLARTVITAAAVRETSVGRNKRVSNCCGRAHRANLAARLQSALPRVACRYVYMSVTPKANDKTVLMTEASTQDALNRVGLGHVSPNCSPVVIQATRQDFWKENDPWYNRPTAITPNGMEGEGISCLWARSLP